jgi:hypothetical protein
VARSAAERAKKISLPTEKKNSAEISKIILPVKKTFLHLCGEFSIVNWLSVVLVQEVEIKILYIARKGDFTGKIEADSVKKALGIWHFAEQIIVLGFDITYCSSGVHNGASTILQQLLDRQLLLLARRHHILELVVRAAFTELFCNTKSPEVTHFKILKTKWSPGGGVGV